MWKSLILPFLATVLPVGSGHGADEGNVSKGGTLAGPGLAAHGYDVVAYFTEVAGNITKADTNWDRIHRQWRQGGGAIVEGLAHRIEAAAELSTFLRSMAWPSLMLEAAIRKPQPTAGCP